MNGLLSELTNQQKEDQLRLEDSSENSNSVASRLSARVVAAIKSDDKQPLTEIPGNQKDDGNVSDASQLSMNTKKRKRDQISRLAKSFDSASVECTKRRKVNGQEATIEVKKQQKNEIGTDLKSSPNNVDPEANGQEQSGDRLASIQQLRKKEALQNAAQARQTRSKRTTDTTVE